MQVGYYGLFGKPILVFRDLDVIKKVLIKDFDHFKNRAFADPDDLNPEVNKHFSNLLTMMKDDKWKIMRTMLTPIFTSGKIKATLPVVNEAAKALTKHFESLEDREDVNAKEEFSKFTAEVLGKMACGIEPELFTKPKDNEYYNQVL